jgi:hypothetical protein
VNIRDWLTGIETNLDDLQSGVDAGSRQVGHLQKATASIDRLRLQPLESADLVGTLLRHTKELEGWVSHQREALVELRVAVSRLRDELMGSNAVGPPPVTGDRHRG